ncbi:MAG: hypothetical protein WBL95_18005 [Microcoleus sp.]
MSTVFLGIFNLYNVSDVSDRVVAGQSLATIYSGSQGSEVPTRVQQQFSSMNRNHQCPMPNALCPMPNALCPMPYALSPMPMSTLFT